MNSIIDEMILHYGEFTKSERKIIDYILSHKCEAQYLSITDLSEACKISVSTISLFCRKLGADGFNVFKLELAKATIPCSSPSLHAVGAVTPDDSMDEVFQKTFSANEDALQRTYQLLDPDAVSKAVDLLEAAGQVLCFGQGNHAIMAQAAWVQFSTVSSRFKTVEESHMQVLTAATMDPGDVLLFFSYSGSTHEFMELAQLVKSRGGKIILITRFPNSPGTALSDLVLLVGATEEPLSYGSVEAMTAQLLVIDILYNEYCRRNFDKANALRGIIGKALAHKCI